MREILFRAKRNDNGEWVEGYYVKTRLGTDTEPSNAIFVPWKQNRFEQWGWIRILPETLCQFTGLYDKNGQKIWEHDIVKCNKRKDGFEFYKVLWRKYYADFGVEPLEFGVQYPISLGEKEQDIRGFDYEIVGNCFDNSETLHRTKNSDGKKS